MFSNSEFFHVFPLFNKTCKSDKNRINTSGLDCQINFFAIKTTLTMMDTILNSLNWNKTYFMKFTLSDKNLQQYI